MTNTEFDNATFCSRDKIVVRRYFRTETERVEWVDFDKRIVNGYKAAEIVEHITIDPRDEKADQQ
jgi:hypothetical protein